MGGQQFATGAVLIDMRPMNRIVAFDAERGIVEAEAGIQWPELVDGLIALQQGRASAWGIIQKQTGADRLTLGGALAANVHGRGLTLRPIIGDVESFTLMDAEGKLARAADREQRALSPRDRRLRLVRHVTRVRLRLMPRTKIERVVTMMDIDDLMPACAERIAEGYLYGDCQFSTDTSSDTYLRRACSRAIAHSRPTRRCRRAEGAERGALARALLLSHADTRRAYEAYSSYYLSTSGQRYWSDSSQLSLYIDDYHAELDRRLGSPAQGQRDDHGAVCPAPGAAVLSRARCARTSVSTRPQLIYGHNSPDRARQPELSRLGARAWACTVMNLHVTHTDEGIRKAAGDFRRLIARAIEYGGSYFLTYHRWATCAQVEACYPQMPEFLRLKRQYDAGEVFQSAGIATTRRCSSTGCRLTTSARTAETLCAWNNLRSSGRG